MAACGSRFSPSNSVSHMAGRTHGAVASSKLQASHPDPLRRLVLGLVGFSGLIRKNPPGWRAAAQPAARPAHQPLSVASSRYGSIQNCLSGSILSCLSGAAEARNQPNSASYIVFGGSRFPGLVRTSWEPGPKITQHLSGTAARNQRSADRLWAASKPLSELHG